MATPRLGLVVEDKPTELSCIRQVSCHMFHERTVCSIFAVRYEIPACTLTTYKLPLCQLKNISHTYMP